MVAKLFHSFLSIPGHVVALEIRGQAIWRWGCAALNLRSVLI
jgi:hypothetical protein